MISAGSCDSEDWSNDAENSDLITAINYILQYTTSQKFLNSKILMFLLKNSLLLTKPAFIWSKIQQKQ